MLNIIETNSIINIIIQTNFNQHTDAPHYNANQIMQIFVNPEFLGKNWRYRLTVIL